MALDGWREHKNDLLAFLEGTGESLSLEIFRKKCHPSVWNDCLETGACLGRDSRSHAAMTGLGQRRLGPSCGDRRVRGGPASCSTEQVPSYCLRECSGASPVYLTIRWASEGFILVSGLLWFRGFPILPD